MLLNSGLHLRLKIAKDYFFFLRSQKWSRQRLELYQDHMLRKLIRHAGRHVPYYRKLFEEIEVDIDGFRGCQDMHRIPPLDKETVRTQPNSFIADNAIKFKPIIAKTSGSTGTPLKLMLSADCRAADASATLRSYQWAGYYPGKRVFTVKGFMSQDWEFQYNMLGTSLNFDSVRLSRETAIRVLREIREFKPHIYHGYPFSLMMLSKIAHDEMIEIPKGQSIIVAGETLSDNCRSVLETVYGGEVFDQYGMTENTAMITECEFGNKHLIEDFAYHEILNEKGDVLETGGQGEIVGTGYYNYAMPLIRYKTRDMATIGTNRYICECGRRFKLVKKIEGRKEDYIETPDGRLVNLIEGAISLGAGIVMSQYVQDSPDHMYVNIVPGTDFDPNSLWGVERGLRERVGRAIKINFEIVSELEKTKGGKIPFILSKIGNKVPA